MATSFVLGYPVNGYQSGKDGVFNPIDVCLYYLVESHTQDWANLLVPLAISPAHQQSMYGMHCWTDGDNVQWAKDLAVTQSLSMQMLYDRHGHTVLPSHPIYTNAELTNILYVGISLLTDPLQRDPLAIPDGIWYRLLNGGNINGWNLVIQDNPELWIEDWPPTNPRDAASSRGKKR